MWREMRSNQAKSSRAELATAVEEEEAAGGLAALVESDGHHGFQIEELLGRARQAGDAFEGAAVAAVPSKAGTGAGEAIPADGGVGVVEEQAVGAGEGQVVGHEAFGFAGFVAPEEDALEIGVAVDEQGFLGVEGAGELFEEEAEALGEALVDLHGGGDAGEEFLLDGEEAVAVAEESDAGSGGEGGASQAEPGNDAEEVDFAFDDGEKNDFKGEQAGQGKCGVQAPADARDITDEKIRKPGRNHRWADDHEIAEGDEIDEERQVPGPTWENLFEEDGAERQDQIADQKGDRAIGVLRRWLLQQRDQRHEDGDRAGVGDLPLDVAAIGLVWIHARGRIPVRLVSLARDDGRIGAGFLMETCHFHDTKTEIHLWKGFDRGRGREAYGQAEDADDRRFGVG